MQLGIELMMYGLAGVFSVLIVFMLAIKIMTVLLPYKDSREDD